MVEDIRETYNSTTQYLQKFQDISEQDILKQAGAAGYIALMSLKLVIQLIVLAPVYVGRTLDNIMSSVGMPGELSYTITLLTYLSFVLWVRDVIRGRSVSDQ